MSDNKFPKFNFNMEYETYNPPRQFTPIPANRKCQKLAKQFILSVWMVIPTIARKI